MSTNEPNTSAPSPGRIPPPEGLSLREYYAAVALLGLLSSGKCLPERAGDLAVRAADDTVAALKRGSPGA